ncbi:MAG: EAL domain-containing protein [Pseudobutyrivibrio sp.]|nr:EAL domain-containing protein [Pseudobutyrivibrio sp.]
MSEQYYDTLMNGKIPRGLPGGFFIYNAEEDEEIIFAEDNVVKLFGCDDFQDFMEHVGGNFRGMVHPDDLIKIENQIEAQTIYAAKRHDYVRYRIVAKDGTVKYIEDFGHLLHWTNGKSFYYVFIVDVDRNEYLNANSSPYANIEQLMLSGDNDELTGLLSMVSFYSKVQSLLSTPEINRQSVAFVHFDVPNFKLFNERYGFAKGDELLCEIGHTIKDIFYGATVARFSDDHFVLFSTLPEKEVIESVEEVYRQLLLSKDVIKKVKIKAGIYFMDDKRAEVSLACDHARLACNSIKSRHDVNYCVYDDIIREKLRQQQFVVDNIDEAIANDYIRVYYQPIIRVATDEICGYEALVRWDDPVAGMLQPSYFIETLEHFHLIHLVDEYVVKKVCQDYRRLADQGEALVPISINISRLDFEVCDVFKLLSDFCEIYDVPREMIDVEITESAFADNNGLLKDSVARIRDAGYEIWIDDFGSGYSSLTTLTDYLFDVLKLDMVFLKTLKEIPKTKTLMGLIVEAAKELEVLSLTEGVETEEQYMFLKEIGCDMAQGYYFSKPMPLDDILESAYAKGMQWENN